MYKRQPSNVKVIGWADASAFWSAVDIALSTSDNEGMPVALIEAQLAGIPVVATDVGSNAEVIEDEVTGLVVEKDVADLAHAVSRLISDGDLRERMGIAAMDRASAEFGVKTMLERHALVYAGIQTSRSAGSH